MSNTIKKMYDNDNADISVGIMIDMKTKTETFIIGMKCPLSSRQPKKQKNV